MHLQWMELRDFRSYESLSLDFDRGINIFVGENGAGKTNLLEGAAYLSLLRSLRGAPDQALVRIGAASAVVRGSFSGPVGETLLEVELPAAGRRRVLLNGKRPARFGAVASEVPVVTFLPDDLAMVKRGPAYRRDYVDQLCALLWPAAGAEQRDYERALRQRNALLRQEGRDADPATLAALEAHLAGNGARVVMRRHAVLTRLGPHLTRVYEEIVSLPVAVEWLYRPSGLAGEPGDNEEGIREELQAALAERRRVDQERKVTTVGPHRDEIGFTVAGRDTRLHASQGEQRSVALSMRLGAYELLREQNGEPPILLLDDVLSELDPGRAAAVVRRLPEAQVLITTAREEDTGLRGRIRHVAGGMVT